MARWPTDQPVDTSYSIPFGHPDPAAAFGKHAGIDINVGTGTPVYAPVSGAITSYVWGIYHGNVVEVKGDDGKYYHMFHNSSLNVAPGQRVSESQLVSKSGATGKGVTGSHVHWGVAKKTIPNITSFNDYINPESTLSSNKEHDMPNEGDVHNTYQKANGRNATPEEVQYYITKTWNQPDGLYYGKTLVDWQHAIDASQKPAGFTPVNEQLYKKD